MIACIINAALILLGCFIGMLFKSRIKQSLCDTLIMGLAVCVIMIGIMYAIKTNSSIIMIVCLVIGTVIGELLDIDGKVEKLGERIKEKVYKKGDNSRFTEGFVTATLLFCVGSMAVVGSIEAGVNHNYSIIISKGIIDGVVAITFGATMGIGVAFSAASIVIYQGAITLIAILFGSFLSSEVITEVNAVGGILIACVGINMLGVLGEKRIRVANMLPGMFVVIGYFPISKLLSEIF